MRITKGPPLRPKAKSTAPGRGEAEALALRALTFILENDERIQKFLQITGVDPNDLSGLAAQPTFLLAVLDYLAGDEELLLSFAQEIQVNPETIGLARRALGGEDAA